MVLAFNLFVHERDLNLDHSLNLGVRLTPWKLGNRTVLPEFGFLFSYWISSLVLAVKFKLETFYIITAL